MINTKKCTECGQWSEWNHYLEDKCEFCGELLQKEKYELHEKKRLEKIEKEKNFIFNINKEDNVFVMIIKKGGYLIYLLIMTIVSILSWLMFWLGP